MKSGKEVTLSLRLIDGVTAPGKAAAAALHQLNRSVKGMESGARAFAGFAAGAIATVGFARAAEDAVRQSAALDSVLGEIAIVSNSSSEAMGVAAKRLASYSVATNQLQTDLAGSINLLTAAGLSMGDSVAVVDDIGKASTATGASMDDLSNSWITTSRAFVIGNNDITKSFDAMASSANDGQMSLKSLAKYLPAQASAAAALGMTGLEGNASLAAANQIARRGAGDDSEAANNLRNAMTNIASPETRKSFRKKGVDISKEIAAGIQRGEDPIEVVRKIIDKKTKGGRADLLGELIGDEQARAFWRPLVAGGNDYIEMRDRALKADGLIDRQFEKRSKSVEQKFKRLSVATNNIGLMFGNRIVGPLADFAERLAKTFSTMEGRVGILDRVGAAWSGFTHGIGLGAGGLADAYDALDRAIFGDASTIEADSDAIGRISLTFKTAGENFKAAIAAFNAAGSFADKAHAISDGAKSLYGALGPAGTAGLLAGAAALARVAFVLGRFTIGGTAMRLGGVALGIAGLTGAMDGLGAMDLAGIAIGLASVAAPLFRISKALAGIGKAGAAVKVLGDVAGAAPAAAGVVAPGSKGGKAGGIGAGRAIGTGLGVVGLYDQLSDVTPEKAAARGKAWNEWANANVPTPRSLLGLDKPAAAPAPVVGRMPDTAKLTKGFGTHFGIPPEAVAKFSADMKGMFSAALAGLDAMRPGAGLLAGLATVFATASADATSTGAAMTASLNIKATPIVATGSLDAALGKANALRAAFAGIGGAVPGPVASGMKFGGPRAAGGPVQRGTQFLVGERGPELFTPRRSGTIVPNHTLTGQAGGGTSVVVHMAPITIHGASDGTKVAQQIASSIGGALSRQLSRSKSIGLNGR